MPVTHFPPDAIKAALKHLKSSDPILATVIEQVGDFTLQLEKSKYRILVRSIISQQLSTKAARTIRQRLEATIKPKRVTPENIAGITDEQMRTAGLSRQKITYMRDLTDRVVDGRLKLNKLTSLDDEDVIAELIQVKGIGRWTAQMFLMFCLGRLDVFPVDDWGIRSNIRNLYGFDEMPNKAQCLEVSEPWHPYASIASWYCWRSGDVEEVKTPGAEYPV
ncbi:MAG: DNA-3-methyladenine glycosylase [Planctomycetaceae bacterium]|nr:DNA-3-methyladenine glycosylase [Planctomycetaceae bacterium]